jgi:hypothetical protein
MVVVAIEWELNQTDEPTKALGLLFERKTCEMHASRCKLTRYVCDVSSSHLALQHTHARPRQHHRSLRHTSRTIERRSGNAVPHSHLHAIIQAFPATQKPQLAQPSFADPNQAFATFLVPCLRRLKLVKINDPPHHRAANRLNPVVKQSSGRDVDRFVAGNLPMRWSRTRGMMSFCARELWPCDGCKVGRLLSGRWAEEYIGLRDVDCSSSVNKVLSLLFVSPLELGWFVECRCCPGTLRSVVCCTAPSTTVKPITNKHFASSPRAIVYTYSLSPNNLHHTTSQQPQLINYNDGSFQQAHHDACRRRHYNGNWDDREED